MDPVAFAEQYDTRPQQLLASMDQQNQQTMQNVLQGTSIFQQGNLERAKMAQEKSLSMAQLAQNQQQFTALQGLREQELQMNQGKTMADIAMMNASLQGQDIQNQQQQLAAQQAPLKLQNQAYLTQNMSKVMDPENGPQQALSLLSQVPNPDAMSDQDRQSFLANADLARSQSGAELAYKGNLSGQLGTLTEGAQLGLHMQNYMKDQKGSPYDPRNFDMDKVATDVYHAKVAQQMNVINAQGQQRMNVAQVMAGARTDTGKARIQALSAQEKQAQADYTKAATSIMASTPQGQQVMMAAKARLDQARSALNSEMGLSPDEDTMDSPGATGATAPTDQSSTTPPPNPAASAWLSNVAPPATNGR